MLFNNTNNFPQSLHIKKKHKKTIFHGYWEACKKCAHVIFLKCGISASQKQVQDHYCKTL